MIKQITQIGYTAFYNITIPTNSKSYLVSVERQIDEDNDIHQYARIWMNGEWKPFIEMTNTALDEIVHQVEILLANLN